MVTSVGQRLAQQSPAGAAEVREYHRQLFRDSADTLRQEIRRLTGVDVREAGAEVEPTMGTVVQVFTAGTTVQVYLLAREMPPSSWSGRGTGESFLKTEVQPC